MPNTLIFVDLPVSDTEAAHRFYQELFGWEINPRPAGEFLQVVPGEGLHLGIFDDTKQTPDPDPQPQPARAGLAARTYILVENEPASYVEKAVELGATELWGEAWWPEFNGWHASFRDPWGNQIVLWYSGKPAPEGA